MTFGKFWRTRGAPGSAAASACATAGSGQARRDHYRDDLADMADFRPDDRLVFWHDGRRAVAVLDLDVGGVAVADMRQRPQPVGFDILGRQYREHPGHRACCRGIDRAHPGMRVRRSHHDRVGLAGQVDIVAVAALPGQEALILAPPYRLPDPGLADLADRRSVHRGGYAGKDRKHLSEARM
jgi:hypothetical protein